MAMAPALRRLVFLTRLSVVGTVALLLVAPVASASERVGPVASFPGGSLALGHPVLFSEDVASGGIVTSRVPVASQVAADELLVTFAPGAQGRVQRRIPSQRDLSLVGALPDLPADLVRFAAGDRMRALDWLGAQRGVESVQPNVIEYPDQAACAPAADCTVPNDPAFPYQWYLDNAPGDTLPPSAGAPVYGSDVDAPLAWARTRGSPDVRIAVVDTGIDAGHPDLAGKVVAAANFTASNTAADLSGHGTHVAGIAAANFDNGIGVAGMAPNARLMDIKVLAVDANGRTAGDCADAADGIVWATNHGANVINMRLGSRGPCQAMALAVDYAYSTARFRSPPPATTRAPARTTPRRTTTSSRLPPPPPATSWQASPTGERVGLT